MTEGCKTCKEKGPSKFQIGAIVLGFYVLGMTIYGTIEFVKNIMGYFK
jgi:hypothetical protein